MTSLQLTKEQKDKLLKMCKVLFPGYDVYTFWNGNFLGMHHLIDGEEADEDNISIHWFEFCLTHLLNKLADYGVMGLYNCTGLFGIEHPVDFLYEKYLKLKPTKSKKKQTPIKVGDKIYRIYPSGKKVLGIACAVRVCNYDRTNNVYDDSNSYSKWRGFISLETYKDEGGVTKNQGYEKGSYKYEKV